MLINLYLFLKSRFLSILHSVVQSSCTLTFKSLVLGTICKSANKSWEPIFSNFFLRLHKWLVNDGLTVFTSQFRKSLQEGVIFTEVVNEIFTDGANNLSGVFILNRLIEEAVGLTENVTDWCSKCFLNTVSIGAESGKRSVSSVVERIIFENVFLSSLC